MKGSIERLPGDLSYLSDEKLFLSFAIVKSIANYNNFLSIIILSQQWCENRDNTSMNLTLIYDPHSPAHARVVLSPANFDEFAKTLNCRVGSRMNLKDKCII